MVETAARAGLHADTIRREKKPNALHFRFDETDETFSFTLDQKIHTTESPSSFNLKYFTLKSNKQMQTFWNAKLQRTDCRFKATMSFPGNISTERTLTF